MADEAVGEAVKPVVRYEKRFFSDTQGRAFAQFAALDGSSVRYQGQAMLIAGQVQIPFPFEISAVSVAEAFEKYDGRRDEEGKKLGDELQWAALSQRIQSPLIGDFRAEKLRRRFGGNGG